MAKLLFLLALLAATFAVTSSAAAPRCRPPWVGGWNPIPGTNDPDIMKVGGWAVAQAKVNLQFCRVTRGEQQVVAGMNYILIVEAVDGAGKTAAYVAKVSQDLSDNRTLNSFKPAAKCPMPMDLCSEH